MLIPLQLLKGRERRFFLFYFNWLVNLEHFPRPPRIGIKLQGQLLNHNFTHVHFAMFDQVNLLLPLGTVALGGIK